MKEEFNIVVTKIKSRKAASLNEIFSEVWKTRKFDDLLLGFCNAICKQNTIERWTKACIFLFLKKGNLGITKNYRYMTLTSIIVKVYNALLIICIKPKIV